MSTNEFEDDLVNYSDEEENKPEGGKGNSPAKSGVKGHYVSMNSASFKDLGLSEPLLRAIVDCGFEQPSEVQHSIIPKAILGNDILCQARAGMGKTAVFVLATLHQLEVDEKKTSVVVLVHTHEMAYQIQKEYERFTKYMKGVTTGVYYGGIPYKQNKEELAKEVPQIVIGCPGRVAQLVKEGLLNLGSVKHFVLDECDTLLSNLSMRADMQSIFIKTPLEKQVMMFSATLPEELKALSRRFMSKNAMELLLDSESGLVLHGLQMYYVKVTEETKTRKLIDLLDTLEFNQIIIFVAKLPRAVELNRLLVECNFPSVCIYKGMEPKKRAQVFNDFKEYKSRIMISTDLLGRGVDIERVNVVINFDFPKDTDGYIHRVNRAGRFGTKGLALSFCSSAEDMQHLDEVKTRFSCEIGEVPATLTL